MSNDNIRKAKELKKLEKDSKTEDVFVTENKENTKAGEVVIAE